jgi:hypothetical protein
MRRRVKWAEVWADYANLGGYLLTLRAYDDGSFEILDPQKGGEVVETFSSHDDAMHWLSEDEYDLVGRLSADEPDIEQPRPTTPGDAAER